MAGDTGSLRLLWPPPPAEPALEGGEIHVWSAALDQPAVPLDQLWPVLSPDEQARAQRFYFERDRNHFVVARGLLRLLLGRYLGVEPQQLAFDYGPQGKPVLAAPWADGTLAFNLSHSAGLALYAAGRGAVIGVDVERIRPLDDMARIARTTFSAHENVTFAAVPAAQQAEAFFNCWTRKEAYIKAIGEGLSCPLGEFDVSLAPGEPARLLRIRGSEAAAARWSLHDLQPAAGYTAALVVAETHCTLSCWQWPLTAEVLTTEVLTR